ncbi:MAG: hypothetical protein KAX49_20610, partial [Halanaerobiales bacterium]|nr:hypothetical protein [Halanaerobiales bacterium]
MKVMFLTGHIQDIMHGTRIMMEAERLSERGIKLFKLSILPINLYLKEMRGGSSTEYQKEKIHRVYNLPRFPIGKHLIMMYICLILNICITIPFATIIIKKEKIKIIHAHGQYACFLGAILKKVLGMKLIF